MIRYRTFGCLFLAATLFGAEETSATGPELVAMLQAGSRTTIFAKLPGDKVATQLTKVGAVVGPFEYASADVAKGWADFTRDGKTYRAWLPESSVKSGKGSEAQFVVLPPLNTLKGLIGADESIASRGDPKVNEEKLRNRLSAGINDPKLSWEERVQKLDNLVTGKSKYILSPMGKGVDEAFAKKYGLSQEEVDEVNWGEAVAIEHTRREKERKAAEKAAAEKAAGAQPVTSRKN